MMIHGYKVLDFKLISDGEGKLIPAERTCDMCIGSTPKVVEANLEGKWKKVKVCTDCMIEHGLFLDHNDLEEEIKTLNGGRSKG
ncbi:MAG: hypothetical protein GY799_21025 [Desulfobulbaceae bacterium]|nr:hypothetical protein [Desulfobulbaceae bacterium]